MNNSQKRISRFSLFKGILVTAAKSPPAAPAFLAQKPVEDFGDSCAAITGSDRAISSSAKPPEVPWSILAERQAAAKEYAVWKVAGIEARRVAEESRIEALPDAARHRAEIKRTMVKILSAIGTLIAVVYCIGNVAYFAVAVFYLWPLWLILVGALFAIFSAIMVAGHWRVIVSVVRSVPSAIFAAVSGRRLTNSPRVRVQQRLTISLKVRVQGETIPLEDWLQSLPPGGKLQFLPASAGSGSPLQAGPTGLPNLESVSREIAESADEKTPA
jgi:hypothetical protein